MIGQHWGQSWNTFSPVIRREDIKAGNAWSVQIVEAIDTCPAFVLALSPNSAASKEVQHEVYLSHESRRAMFIVMLEPDRSPNEIRYQLAGKQILDVDRMGLEKAIEELTTMVKEYVAQFEPVEPPAQCQVELVIQGINLKYLAADKQAQVLDLRAQLTGGELERQDERKPRYLLELWLCWDGELQFTPTGSWDLTEPRSTLRITDEAGCSEPLHGVIYLAEKHGYAGPVEIPWPAFPASTSTP